MSVFKFNCCKCQNEITLYQSPCTGCGFKKPFKGINLTSDDVKEWDYTDIKAFMAGGGKASASKKETAVVILIFAVVFAWFINRDTTPDPERVAMSKCRSQIRQILNVPDSMRTLADAIQPVGENGTYTARFEIESQNAFGVYLPSSFSCNVVTRENGDMIASVSRL